MAAGRKRKVGKGAAAAAAKKKTCSTATTTMEAACTDPVRWVKGLRRGTAAIEKEALGAARAAADKLLTTPIAQALEQAGFLERAIVPALQSIKDDDDDDHKLEVLMCGMAMVVERARQDVPPFATVDPPQVLGDLLRRCAALDPSDLSEPQRGLWLAFHVVAFRSLEQEEVRSALLRLVSLQIFARLSERGRQRELTRSPKLHKYYNKLVRREKKQREAAGKGACGHVALRDSLEATFFPRAHDELCAGAAEGGTNFMLFLQLCCELLSQLPTRRFVRSYLLDKGMLARCEWAASGSGEAATLTGKLAAMVASLLRFEVRDEDGAAVSDEEALSTHYDECQRIQRLVYREYPREKLSKFPLANCAKACEPGFLRSEVCDRLSDDELKDLVCHKCGILDPDCDVGSTRSGLETSFLEHMRVPLARAKMLEGLALYPTERDLAVTGGREASKASGGGAAGSFLCTGLPRMNLQFLTMRDYLVRSFELLKLEAAAEIREEVFDAAARVGAYLGDEGDLRFSGWARMAAPIASFAVKRVDPPALGEDRPRRVLGEISIDLGDFRRADVRSEWDCVRRHDVLFLVAVRPPREEGWRGGGAAAMDVGEEEASLISRARGCEVVDIRDAAGRSLPHFAFEHDNPRPPSGTRRTILVDLDPTQHHYDCQGQEDQKASCSYHLAVRLGANQSNFKSVLECVRGLACEDRELPPWLHDVFLGYGDPNSSHFTFMDQQDQILELDFADTFAGGDDHLRSCFPGWDVKIEGEAGSADVAAFHRARIAGPLRRREGAGQVTRLEPATMVVERYRGADIAADTATAGVRFTGAQAEAILSGLQRGLTMVVGPPGTGKTDVAAQVLRLLYRNYPGERVLLLTHSNQALNDLFLKISNRGFPSRYLVRLGSGESELETEEAFSRLGRVNAMLERRLELLARVDGLAKTLKVVGDHGSNCETCANFWVLHVAPRWERFSSEARGEKDAAKVCEHFPFADFFASQGSPKLPVEEGAEACLVEAGSRFSRLKELFEEIEECRPFELLHSQQERLNYMTTKQAKVVAMTCTYAALKRKDFIRLGLEFDTVVMEEAAQVLDVETLIPIRLQRDDRGTRRLKRVVLIGDHNQLPPVVKDHDLSRSTNLQQSLFSRLVRLGAPYSELDAQGRCRPDLASLYNWRYRNLGDLPRVEGGEYALANAGFAHVSQFLDVPGQESSPRPHFVQNLQEAEHAVTLYQHMRLLGYPAEKIVILTTYNGQKALLRDVVERRCASHFLFGRPRKVETVDRFQGQQSDYVILSLVRTKAVGHLRDVRRLVVAVSRARLGLFMLGNREVFENCVEIKPAISHLLERPTTLMVVPGEAHPTQRKQSDEAGAVPITMEDLTRGVVMKVQEIESSGKGAGSTTPA